MILQTQSIFSTHSIHSSIFPVTRTTTTLQFPHKSSSQFKPHTTTLTCPRQRSFPVLSSLASPPAEAETVTTNNKPSPAQVSRTIMELSSVATLSFLTPDGFPLAIGVRFAVEPEQGTPILCFNPSFFPNDPKSSLHVQLEQCGLRTPQCTIQGCLDKPQDASLLKKLQSIWKKRFNEDVDEDLIHIIAVERVLQTEDFMEEGVWFTSLDYKMAVPDPLRDSAESIVHEINTNNMEDIHRFCNIYVDLNFLGAQITIFFGFHTIGFAPIGPRQWQDGVRIAFDIIKLRMEIDGLHTEVSPVFNQPQKCWSVGR